MIRQLMPSLINKLSFFYPPNPIDPRAISRLKRGLVQYAQVNSRWALPVLQRWIRRQRFNFVWRDCQHTRLLRVSGDDITHLWAAYEVLVEKVYDLSKVPFLPDVVIDLGANIGAFTLYASSYWPAATFICVEPHPITFSFLCDNLDNNGIGASKLQCAVDVGTELQFLGNEGAIYQKLSKTEVAGAAKTLTLPFASLLLTDKAKLLIKMDIEGSEREILSQLKTQLPEKCFVFIELHDGDSSLQWMDEWAAANGFVFVNVRRRDDAIDGYLIRSD